MKIALIGLDFLLTSARFAKNKLWLLALFAKHSILDARHGFECTY